MNIARADVAELKVKQQRPLRSRILGPVIGAGAGIGAIAIADGALTDGNGMSGKYAAMLGAVGAGIGFLATLGPTYNTVYKLY